jgi:three-Cys-motif partner protein
LAPYDLDLHVQRVLKQSLKPVQRRAESPQMSLFEMEPSPVPRSRKYETQSGLVVDEAEMLFARAVSFHSSVKAYYARRYAEIVGTAMRSKWYLTWVELFAGPGKLYLRDRDEFVPGSPLEALAIARPFHRYVFSDLDLACVESLRRRIGKRDNVHILQGDANSPELLVELAKLIPTKNSLVVLYGDPAGLDLKWDTVQFFIDRFKHLDLLLNVPITGVVRAVAAGYDEKAGALLGHPDPRALYDASAPDKGVAYRDWFRRKCAAEGFTQLEAIRVSLRGTNRDLYDLALASRNPLATKFFREAAGIQPGETRASAR